MLIVDAHSIGSRAFYVGSYDRFFSMVETAAAETNQAEVVFAFDHKDNWRKAKYPQYKANRKPDTAKKQFLRNIFKTLRILGHTPAWFEGLEADDVIASIVRPDDIIFSGDQDLFALLDSHCAGVFYPGSKFSDRQLITTEKFIAKFEFHPKQLRLYKTLVGDSDNIPGLKGAGKVIVTRWLKETNALTLQTLIPVDDAVRQNIEELNLYYTILGFRTRQIPFKAQPVSTLAPYKRVLGKVLTA